MEITNRKFFQEAQQVKRRASSGRYGRTRVQERILFLDGRGKACFSTTGMKPIEKEKKPKKPKQGLLRKQKGIQYTTQKKIILRQETRTTVPSTGQCYECTQAVGVANIQIYMKLSLFDAFYSIFSVKQEVRSSRKKDRRFEKNERHFKWPLSGLS